jgi:hypothetical protein
MGWGTGCRGELVYKVIVFRLLGYAARRVWLSCGRVCLG